MVVGGGLALNTMRRETFPQFSVDKIFVTVAYPGADPEEVEEGICIKIEEQIQSIEGIERLRSTAREGSGEVIAELTQEMTGPMGHDRCYRNYITERYFINSKTGGADFLELETGAEFPNHWTRGGCGMGVLPANGLVYSTPYSCTCSMGSMFQGMNAYASPQPAMERSDDPVTVRRSVRLEKGPAYGRITEATSATEEDWPAYRYDGFRSGKGLFQGAIA